MCGLWGIWFIFLPQIYYRWVIYGAHLRITSLSVAQKHFDVHRFVVCRIGSQEFETILWMSFVLQLDLINVNQKLGIFVKLCTAWHTTSHAIRHLNFFRNLKLWVTSVCFKRVSAENSDIKKQVSFPVNCIQNQIQHPRRSKVVCSIRQLQVQHNSLLTSVSAPDQWIHSFQNFASLFPIVWIHVHRYIVSSILLLFKKAFLRGHCKFTNHNPSHDRLTECDRHASFWHTVLNVELGIVFNWDLLWCYRISCCVVEEVFAVWKQFGIPVDVYLVELRQHRVKVHPENAFIFFQAIIAESFFKFGGPGRIPKTVRAIPSEMAPRIFNKHKS